MKQDSGVVTFFAVVFGCAAVAMGLWVAWLARDVMRDAVMVLVIGAAVAGVLFAASFPIRQWRRSDANPVVEHHYHDGTKVIERHTIDGRQVQPTLYQLPAQQQNAGAFPELLRAAWLAGRLDTPGNTSAGADQAQELTPDDWGGPIN